MSFPILVFLSMEGDDRFEASPLSLFAPFSLRSTRQEGKFSEKRSKVGRILGARGLERHRVGWIG